MNDEHDIHLGVEAYVLGALDPDEREEFEKHLPACFECRAQIRAYDGVMQTLRSMPVATPPPVPRVLGRRRAFTRYEALAAAFALLAVTAAFGVPKIAQYEHSERAYAAIASMLATDPQEVALTGSTGATGRAIVGDGHRRTGFVATGLPAPRPGMVYRVWVRGRGERFSPGTLEATPEGLQVLVTTGDALRGVRAIRITLEPAGGASPRQRRIMLQGTVG